MVKRTRLKKTESGRKVRLYRRLGHELLEDFRGLSVADAKKQYESLSFKDRTILSVFLGTSIALGLVAPPVFIGLITALGTGSGLMYGARLKEKLGKRK